VVEVNITSEKSGWYHATLWEYSGNSGMVLTSPLPPKP
jgi:hypothetical protein